MDGKRGTRAKIPPRSQAHIIARAIETPRKPRRELARELQGELKQKGFDVPELEVLEKKISKYRNEIIDGPEDKPWSLLALTGYDISAEVLPIVFDLWAYALLEFRKPLTIREVKWVARLSQIIRNDRIGLLEYALRYAAYEKAYWTLENKNIVSIMDEVRFHVDTELYADFCPLVKPTGEELLKVPEDPNIQKRKRQKLLDELRSPEILRRLGFKVEVSQLKRKRGKANEGINKAKRKT